MGKIPMEVFCFACPPYCQPLVTATKLTVWHFPRLLNWRPKMGNDHLKGVFTSAKPHHANPFCWTRLNLSHLCSLNGIAWLYISTAPFRSELLQSLGLAESTVCLLQNLLGLRPLHTWKITFLSLGCKLATIVPSSGSHSSLEPAHFSSLETASPFR